MEEKYILNILQNCDFALLATVNEDGFPDARYMANNMNWKNDNFVLHFSTNVSSEKVQHLKHNNKASIYYCDMKTMQSATVYGTIKVLTDKESLNKYWMDEFGNYYKEGKNDPEYSVLEFTAESYKFIDNETYKTFKGSLK